MTRDVISDVVVVGAGIVGSAIARALAGTRLSVTLVEGRADVGDGTSKANTALLHTGFDATPGTLESRLVARGYQLLGDYAEQTGIPVERTGAMLVAWTDEEARRPARAGRQSRTQRLPASAASCGAEEVYRRVPDLGPGALAGVDGARRVDHLHLDHQPGARHRRGRARGPAAARSTGDRGGGRSRRHTTLHTTGGDVRARWVINAAGLGADHLDAEFGYQRFTVTPRRGRAARVRQAGPPDGAGDRAARCRPRAARACWSARPSTATSWWARRRRT